MRIECLCCPVTPRASAETARLNTQQSEWYHLLIIFETMVANFVSELPTEVSIRPSKAAQRIDNLHIRIRTTRKYVPQREAKTFKKKL